MIEEIGEFFIKLFQTTDFPARWVCGKWTDFHGWLYISSNLAIWAAYFAIPVTLSYFINQKENIPFKKVFISFIAFILFCGLTHLLDALMFWYPLYRINALLLFGTAIVSWSTVFVLYKEFPNILAYKSPQELEKIIEEKTKELINANQKLAESEAHFRALVNSNPDNITKLDKENKHTYVNESLEMSIGMPASFFIGKTPLELGYQEEEASLYVKNIQEVFQTKKQIEYDIEVNVPNEVMYYHVAIVPLLSAQEIVNEVLVVSKNITEKKIAEQKLVQNIKDLQVLSKKLTEKIGQLENFAHIVSHNLRSPIGNLEGLLNLYQEETTVEGKEILVNHFRECTEKLNQTVADLVEVVNIRQDVALDYKILNFDETLENLMSSISVQLSDTQAKITCDFSECPTMLYPKVYLESIMLNLLTNAVKYRSPERYPEIHFKTKRDDDKIILICSDNGIGIDLERNGHKLFGLHKTFHRNPDARGVGLFITKNQVEALGGIIFAESQLNKGTTFTITFNDKKDAENN
jgi:PAS domain S-box-containing protein